MKETTFRYAAAQLTGGMTILTAGLAAAEASHAGVKSPPAPFRLAASVEEMSLGKRTAYICGIQEALREHGYRPGLVDGKLGPQTHAAIRQYQQDAELPVTGEATSMLLDHLKFAQPKVMARASRQPSRLVTKIQRALRERGYEPGPVDGVTGRRTREAIELYQREAGLPVTGRADEALLYELRPRN